MKTEEESETVVGARSAILDAVADKGGAATLPPRIVADAFPGLDMTERCEAMLYWAETNDLEVRSHKACDPEEMCEEWPCGPIDFEAIKLLSRKTEF